MTGLDPDQDEPRRDDAPRRPGSPALGRLADGAPITPAALLAAVGGVRGAIETIVPTVLFVVLFQVAAIRLAPHEVPRDVLAVCVGVPLVVAVVLLLVRIVRREVVSSAIGGLVVLGVSAVLALVTGNPNDNYLPGLIQNAAYAVVLLVSLAVRRPLLGVLAALLLQQGPGWRTDRRRFRVAVALTALWIGMFGLRLAVEVPLYLAQNAVVALGVARILLGVPLYACVLVVTVVVVRATWRTPLPDAAL